MEARNASAREMAVQMTRNRDLILVVGTSPRMIRYFLSGAIATTVNFGVFLALHSLQPFYRVSVIVGYLSGTALAYALSRLWVFQSEQSISRESAKFVALDLVALLLQLAVLDSLLLLELEIPLANAISIFLVVFIKYFLAKHLVFRPRR